MEITYHTVKYADQYLKRKFLDWTDAELKRTRLEYLQDASMIKAEMVRRGLINE